MKATCWYKNGSLDSFRQFCIQNQDKPVSVKLTNRSEPVTGALCNYYLNSSNAEGLFLLLTDRVFHPAYYGLEGIESMHLERYEAPPPMIDIESSKDMSPAMIMALRRSAMRSAK